MRPSLLKYLQIVLFVAIMPFVSLADVEKRNFTLVIDAGHGGHDAGAIGAYSKERISILKWRWHLAGWLKIIALT